jgi:hypothetical protein
VHYQPRSEPIAHVVKKRKASGVKIPPSPLKKSSGVKRRRKASSQMGDKIFEQEVLLTKPLKLSKKFTTKGTMAHSLSLSVREKASSIKTSFHSPPVAMVAGCHETSISYANISSICKK